MRDHRAPPVDSPPVELDRRRALAGSGALVGAAWVAPQIISVSAAAAATVVPLVVVVATGASGTIISSPDALTWTERVSTTTNNLKGVAYSPTLALYAAVGSGGTIVTSPDGVTWTTRTSPTNRELNSVEWDVAGARFVAVGNARTTVVSTNGVLWTLTQSGAVGSPDYLSVIIGPSGLLVAVGTGGTIDTSTDAVTWVPQTSGTANDLNDVEWFAEAGSFFAVGAAGTAHSSPDGVTWSAVATGTGDPLSTVEWSDPLDEVLAGEDSADGQVYGSTGGAFVLRGAVGASIKAIAFSPSLALYIAVGSSGSVWTSPTGTAWTPQTSPTQQNLLAVVASF